MGHTKNSKNSNAKYPSSYNTDRLVSYEYDDRGLRTKLIYPDDSYITYEYDALSRLTKIIDDSNNILAQYQYDELSRRTLVTLP